MNTRFTPTGAGGTVTPAMPPSVVAPEREDIARWRQLSAAHGRIEDALSQALNEVKLSVVEFTVLDVIHEQINGHLRMQDIADVAGLTPRPAPPCPACPPAIRRDWSTGWRDETCCAGSSATTTGAGSTAS